MKEQRKVWVTDLRSVEIEICTNCNLRCVNCDRSVRQAPSNEHMSVVQVRKFVDESIALNWRWAQITLLGGEPTLHPHFDQIVGTLAVYHAHEPSTAFRVLSNGYGERVNAVLGSLPQWIACVVTHKDPRVRPTFSPVNLAPRDAAGAETADFSTGCSITELSGLGLSRYGYYPCGPGASIDRVFGFDIGIKSLSEVTPERLKAQLRLLCGFCGHFTHFDVPSLEARIAHNERRFPDGMGEAARVILLREVTDVWTSQEVISPSWKDAYEEYRKARPLLSTY